MTEEQGEVQKIDPNSVTLKFVTDEECTPCQQIIKHLEGYGGRYEIIDPLSEEAERFWGDDEIAFPAAVIEREDGSEVACEVFLDDQNLIVKCDEKILVIHQPPEELVESFLPEQAIQEEPTVPEFPSVPDEASEDHPGT